MIREGQPLTEPLQSSFLRTSEYPTQMIHKHMETCMPWNKG